MRMLLLVLALGLLLPLGVEARQKRNVILVEDYAHPDWSPVIERGVADFNAAMPKGGPRFVYRRAGAVKDCWRMKQARKRDRAVRICSVEHHPGGSAHRRNVWLNDAYADGGGRYDPAWLFCHEFMHALTGLGDYYQHGFARPPYPETDCFWGWNPTPGPNDAAQVQAAFQQRKRRNH